MKRLLLLLSVFTFCFAAFAQNMCTNPISTSYFNTEYSNINSMTNTTSKINYATNFANNNCLYSNQIKQITMLFYSDQDKLTFSKAAYRNCWDKENFYDVYDAFAYFSNVFRLHDYVIAQRGTNTNTNIVTTTTTTTYDYPNYTYPDYTGYFGITGCNMPMDEYSFNNNYQGFKMSKLGESAKSISIRDFINNNCLSTAQIMKLVSVLSTESYRLDVLKQAYLRAYDRTNFSYANQLLTNQTYRLDFEAYLKTNGGTTTTTIVTNTNTNCAVTSTDMADIKKSINAASFDNTKITTAKQILAAKKCFSVAQIKEILQLFSFESSKLEVAKYAYDFCIDKTNYYQVNDVFSFSSSKDELSKYVQSKQ